MAEAEHVGVEIAESPEGTAGRRTVSVERSEDHLSAVLCGDVPGEQHSHFSQDLVGVHFTIHECWRGIRNVGGHLSVQRLLSVCEHRLVARPFPADERGVSPVSKDFHTRPGADLGGGTDVVGVPVGQHHLGERITVKSPVAKSGGDHLTVTNAAGVDKEHPASVTQKVGLAGRTDQHPQIVTKVEDVHVGSG